VRSRRLRVKHIIQNTTCGRGEWPVCEGPVHRSHSVRMRGFEDEGLEDATDLPYSMARHEESCARIQTGWNRACYAGGQNDHRRFSHIKTRESVIHT
jgi:hypothetical protein